MNFKLEWKKIFICFAAVTGMGFFLSFLILCNLGTDPCTFMNRSIAARLGMTFGNLQLIVNISILIVVFLIKKSLIGFGTLFNMILIGYYADFFCWLWKKTIPDQAFTTPIGRWSIFFAALICFVFSAAIYINVDMGVSPYDALPVIITDKVTKKYPAFPKTLIRILYDGSAIIIGMLVGGVPVVGIVLMALFLGPVITLVKKMFTKI